MSAEKIKLNRAYLGLGSNIEPKKNLPEAIELLKQYGELAAVSSAWETEPVGSDGPNFLNAAALFLTPLTIHDLKNKILRGIEEKLGRQRNSDKNSPRTIDIDILVFNGQLVESELWNFAHLAVPLAEIYPTFAQEDTNLTLKEAARQLRETYFVHRTPGVLANKRKEP